MVMLLWSMPFAVEASSPREGDAASNSLPPGKTAAALVAPSAAAVADFVNREVPDLLRHSWVPGATVSVVKGGQILFMGGYGLANVDTGAPVDPSATLFRVGSITKVMTTAAALELVERGKLSLDTDVNRYLHSVRLAPTFPQPVTVRLLMHHRGGFESNLEGLVRTRDADTTLSPEERERVFVRVRPVTAPFYYDNMGFGLLGTVVADVSGTTYREALHTLIFTPLGMTTAEVGLPAGRERDAAACHRADALGRPAVCPQGLIVDMLRGGGDVSATAADMARFMSALLVPGRLLRAETLARMKNTSERLNPLLPGLGLSLREADYAGRRSLGHHGSIDGFNSEFALFPALDLGVFISVNGGGAPAGERMASTVYGPGVASGAYDARPLVEEFVSRFARTFVPLPATAGAPQAVDGASAPSAAAAELPAPSLAGVYSRPDETATSHGQTMAHPTRVGLTADGQLDAYGCAPFVRRGTMYYECTPAAGHTIELGFARDAQGHLWLGHAAIEALERQPD